MNSKFAHKYIKNAHAALGAGSDSDNSPTGDDIKIFKLGLDHKELAENSNYVAEYLKFFIEKNDNISKLFHCFSLLNFIQLNTMFIYSFIDIHSVFEKYIQLIPSDQNKILWDIYCPHVYKYCTLYRIRNIEERRRQTYPQGMKELLNESLLNF